jgi:hypothetical protein
MRLLRDFCEFIKVSSKYPQRVFFRFDLAPGSHAGSAEKLNWKAFARERMLEERSKDSRW